MNELGALYRDCHGVTQDYNQERQWFQKAADKGNPAAMDDLATLYAQGLGVPANSSEAEEWRMRAQRTRAGD
jgi:TPR repeat protein